VGGDRLATELGDLWCRDPELVARYAIDLSGAAKGRALGLVFPRSTEDVVRIVRACAAARVSIVPSGGRTGLAGGAIAARDELVVSFDKMSRIGEIDAAGMTVDVGAGATTQAVQEAAQPFGLTWPVDFAAKGSSHVGGNLATNAGGLNVIRYGSARRWVLGIEAGTAAGDVLQLNRALEKNNTGLDLMHLIIGSEGTLALITGATLKLAPLSRPTAAVLIAVRDFDEILAQLRLAREQHMVVDAFEFFDHKTVARLEARSGITVPLPAAPFYVLMQIADVSVDELERWIALVLERPAVLDGVVARTPGKMSELWRIREMIPDATLTPYGVRANDLSVAVRDIGRFVQDVEAVLAEKYPTWEACMFGHVGDGNLHCCTVPLQPLADPDAQKAVGAGLEVTLFEIVQRYGGSISAEHGIGLGKAPYLQYSRSSAEIAAMRAIKQALDPHGLLNPGKVFGA